MAGCAPAVAPTAPSEGLPDDPGKTETLAACSGGHGIGQIMGQHRDAAQWSSSVTAMINNGAPVTDADLGKVNYLAAHFGP